MTALVQEEGRRTVVALGGEANLSTTSVASDAMSWVIARRTGDVVIDLAELEFIDSATVHVLAEAQRPLQGAGRTMTFRSPSRLAARVLHAFGLSDLIEAREGVEALTADVRIAPDGRRRSGGSPRDRLARRRDTPA